MKTNTISNLCLHYIDWGGTVKYVFPPPFPLNSNIVSHLLIPYPPYPFLCAGIEPKLNILEIVKPVETVEVVIDPDAHHTETEAHLVEEAQVITLDGTKHITTISDETSEQVTRWAAALEGYRKEQERLGIPYGKR